MRPCTGERLLLGHYQHPLNEGTKRDTYCRSRPHSLDIGCTIFTIRFHHALACPIQWRVCDDRRGSDSCSRRSAIEDARLVRDLEPAHDLAEGNTHALERAPNGRVK